MLCYELLREKPIANDEWLYALQASAALPYESLTQLAKELWFPEGSNRVHRMENPAAVKKSAKGDDFSSGTAEEKEEGDERQQGGDEIGGEFSQSVTFSPLAIEVQKRMDEGSIPATPLSRRLLQTALAQNSVG